MGDGSADLSRLVYPRRSGALQGAFGVGATWRPSLSGIPWSMRVDAVGSARLFEHTIRVASRKQTDSTGAVLVDRSSIELTILAFTLVLQTLHPRRSQNYLPG